VRRDGSRERYGSCFDLRIAGFSLEDENDDGINEPGEHLFVRRIQIKNVGKIHGIVSFAKESKTDLIQAGCRHRL